jgi:hypothetical protein
VSAQKTVFVCLVLVFALLANTAVQLLPRTRAAVVVGKHGVQVNIYVGEPAGDQGCTLLVRLERDR